MFMKNFICSLFVSIIVISCANNDDAPISLNIKTINVETISLINGIKSGDTLDSVDVATRSTALGTGSVFQIGFEHGDTVGIFPSEDYQIPFVLPIPVGTTATSSSIIANAWATKKGALYSVYLPWSFTNRYYNKIPWDYRHVQHQTSNNTRDHLGKYWLLASDTVSATVDNFGIAQFKASLACMGAILRIQCAVPAAADYRRIMFVAQSPVFSTYGYYDLFDITTTKEDILHVYNSDPLISVPYMHQPFHASGYTDHVTLDIGSASLLSGKTLTAYIAIPETDLRNQTVTLYLWDSNGNLYYGTKLVPNAQQGLFNRNSIRNIAFTNMQPTTTLNVSLNPWEKDENICPTCTPVAF